MGLGDSNYSKFMHVPRVLRGRLEELGGKPFYTHAEADEVDGLEGTVDAWTAGLWAPLKQAASNSPPTFAPGKLLRSSDLKAAEQTGALDVPQPLNGEEVVAALRAAGQGAELAGVPSAPQGDAGARVELCGGDDAEARWAVEAAGPATEEAQTPHPEGHYGGHTPFYATLTSATLLTAPASERTVIEARLDLSNSNIQYATGDALAIYPQNPPEVVDRLLERLGFAEERKHTVRVFTRDGDAADPATTLAHVRWPCSVEFAFSWKLDITGVPKKSLLRMLAEHCGDAAHAHALKFLCTKAGRDEYRQLVEGTSASLLDILDAFPSCAPPLARLLEALPPLKPRFYSITTSPLVHPHEAAVAFSVVRQDTPFGVKRGVATTWLEHMCRPRLQAGQYGLGAEVQNGGGTAGASLPYAQGDKVGLYVSHAGAFRCPEDLSVPVVMVGPGTGVAPFRGFLEHRRELLKTFSGTPAPCLLFFGCRHPDLDELYRADMSAFERDGTLTKYHVAYSRKGMKKVYVQHLMKQVAEQLTELVLEEEGYVFVCGDGAGMARDVNACLEKEVFMKGGEMDAKEAAAALKEAVRMGKYVRDIWSA